MLGEQWGMMNETGSFAGQVWLWQYTFCYQIKPFSTSAHERAVTPLMAKESPCAPSGAGETSPPITRS
jgi:hypothetical protein